ncbi:MAG TPA: MotA/TolQ/ExbB proton channel family protein [Polyangiaceae bacterium]|jgi:biopolymer transport protein ExbB|nr:MotA/TolQ/ExbB proton channel family protein [Polyangiaceae bacterium]
MNPADAKHGLSLIQMFLKLAQLGAEWVMYLLLAMGFIAAVLVFERLYLYMSTKVDVTRLARKLIELLQAGRLDRAQELVKTGKGIEVRVVSDALALYTEGADAVEEIVQASMIKERQRYERSLSYLGTVGSNAPFIGLLGTVIGVIIAFAELGRNPKGGLEVVGPGISEALVATAVGLVVAIPSLMCFNWMKGLLKRRLANSDFLARIIITQLKRKTQPALSSDYAADDAEKVAEDTALVPAPAGAE